MYTVRVQIALGPKRKSIGLLKECLINAFGCAEMAA
jgi:hypothetical protein